MNTINESAMSQTRAHLPRRQFLAGTGVAAAAVALNQKQTAAGNTIAGSLEKLALFGGPKAVTHPHDDATRWPRYGKEEEEAILELIRRPSYDPNAALEKDWRNFLGVPYAKAHFNGTSALTSMFFALNLPPGSEIMVPSYTFFATILPMRLFGLVPVFVDINPRTLNLDPEDAKKRLNPRVKAILPVHWIGLPADMDIICEWANEKGLIVLEDCAHAHGAKLVLRPGRPVRQVLRPRPRCKTQRPAHGHLGPHGHLQLPDDQTPAGH